MRTDYAQIFQDPHVVERYEHEVYAPDSHASATSRRQQRYLRRLVRRWFREWPPVQHDFACGTGRGIRLLHGVVRAAHGYDPSAAMLAKARELDTPASLHLVAPDGPLPEPAPSSGPVLVTVFRLLLNADPATRERAIAFAARLLPHPAAGLLVLENHGNRSSLRHLRRRGRIGQPWFEELSHRQVRQLLTAYGFELVEWRGCALLPRTCYRWPALRPLARAVDGLAARLPFLSRWSINVLYTARRLPGQVG